MNVITNYIRASAGSIFALAVLSASTSSVASDCPDEVPRHVPHSITGETCPDIGRMGPTKLAIPRHYILGPDFVYAGVDIWNSESYKNRPKKQSFGLEIRYFSIHIRLNNFRPVESERDLSDSIESDRTVMTLPPRDNQWIDVQFNYPSFFKENNKPVDMQNILRRWVSKQFNRKEDFVKDEGTFNGLEHYVSPVPPSVETASGEINEIFYDAKSNKSMIMCSNAIRHVVPHDRLSVCRHLFYTSSGDIRVEVNNIRDKEYYLSRWKDVENGVLFTFNSFIVK